MINVGPDTGAVFVKEYEFFKSQGGLDKPWGKHWKGPIEADSIEDARRIGCETLPGAKPYDRQAKP